MRKANIRVLAAFALLAVCSLIPNATTSTVQAASWRKAYKIEVAFWTPTSVPGVWEGHFGAFFTGSNCTSYRYVGAGDGPPTPDWWGGSKNVALLSKSWLYGWNPGGYHWDVNNHEAYCS